jgi:hypothetical protein
METLIQETREEISKEIMMEQIVNILTSTDPKMVDL